MSNNIHLTYTRCPVPTGFGIALHLGFIKDAFRDYPSVTVGALQNTSDISILQSHFTHTQPNSFRHGGNYPAIYAQASGADTVVIGLSYVDGPQTILARPQSGIRKPADLKGKRILLHRRPHEAIDFVYATARRTYAVALASAGLTFDDVEVIEQVVTRPFVADSQGPLATNLSGASVVKVDAGPGRLTEFVEPLFEGKVDAIMAGSIGPSTPQYQYLLGLKVVFDAASLPLIERANNSTPLVFTVNRALAVERPDLVSEILVQALRAEQWAANNYGDAVRFVAREQFVAEHLVEVAYSPEGLTRSLALGFDPVAIEALKSQVLYLKELGFIQNAFDVEHWLEPRPLEDARRKIAAFSR